jgi:signal transduction histidine kinase
VQRRLDRIGALGAGVAAGTTAVLLAGAGWWIAEQGADRFQSWFLSDAGAGIARAAAIVLVAGLIGFGAGWAVTLPERRKVASATSDLVELSDRLAAGQARLRPLRTGIAEVDTVSEVIARRAHDMARSLAAERDFASDASHQLRTPLTALLMRLEEISETDDAEVVKEEAGIAIAQVERLTRVVDDLLARSRAGNGGQPPAVSLDSVIAALQREWQPAFEQARRSVHVHGERGLFVRMMPVGLSQVLSTLLENSLVHGRGTVDVQARRSGPSVIIEVSDQGDGVPPTMAPHIFERSVSSGTGGSTGLGLALARDLAESNGGRLDLVQAQPPRFALFLSEAGGR